MALVDLLGTVGVCGKAAGASVTRGLLGGVAKDGDSGELGTSMILGLGGTGELGTGSCLLGGESKCWIFGLLIGGESKC